MNNNYVNDSRVVMTLDAGGTNFVFSALQAGKTVVEPFGLPSNALELGACLKNLVDGFEHVRAQLKVPPVAISFAFPGPADYPRGIIGDLPNLPAFRGGIALGPFLEHHFQIPVFINNDGNLFAFGEAMGGFLPEVNEHLAQQGSPRRYRNLIGVTLGTGFGVGLVVNGQMVVGDNSNGGEGWLFRDLLAPDTFIEHHVSAHALCEGYSRHAGCSENQAHTPLEVFEIATGKKTGNKMAAIQTFHDFGTALGEAIATLLTLTDGLVVIGGGLTGAAELFFPALFAQLESTYSLADGNTLSRLIMKVYAWSDADSRKQFLKGKLAQIAIPGTDQTISYDHEARTTLTCSDRGASYAISLGAYIFALQQIDQ